MSFHSRPATSVTCRWEERHNSPIASRPLRPGRDNVLFTDEEVMMMVVVDEEIRLLLDNGCGDDLMETDFSMIAPQSLLTPTNTHSRDSSHG
jgi:hypothetical protein